LCATYFLAVFCRIFLMESKVSTQIATMLSLVLETNTLYRIVVSIVATLLDGAAVVMFRN